MGIWLFPLLLLTACTGSAFTALDDEPGSPEDEIDAASEAEPDADAARDVGEGGDADAGDALADAKAEGGADADVEIDAREPWEAGPDADEMDASDASDTDGDACTKITWYRDDDGDGYGGSVKLEGCEPPATGIWVKRGGDCHDGNPDVHPGQTEFFTEAYPVANDVGKVSFDYDCNGNEEGESNDTTTESECVAKIDKCVGSGYLPVNPKREGDKLNHFCGSATKRTCSPSLIGGLFGCKNSSKTAPPLGCR